MNINASMQVSTEALSGKLISEMGCCDWNSSLGQSNLGRASWLWEVPQSKVSRSKAALAGVFLALKAATLLLQLYLLVSI